MNNQATEVKCDLLDLCRRFNNFHHGIPQVPGPVKPFLSGDLQIGLVRLEFEPALADHPDVFRISDDKVELSPKLSSFEERSAALDAAFRKMRAKGDLESLSGWREETYDVRGPDRSAEPLFKLERSATPILGIRSYGVNINGFVRDGDGKVEAIWLQRRAADKQTWPGKLDHLVGGGLTSGLGVRECALKEGLEEANLDADYAGKRMVSAGIVTILYDTSRGIYPCGEFVFDLELDKDFVPQNNDGEVQGFELVPVKNIVEKICSSEFKTPSSPIVLDFLIRHGIINAENEPNLIAVVENLHVPIHSQFDYFTSGLKLK